MLTATWPTSEDASGDPRLRAAGRVRMATGGVREIAGLRVTLTRSDGPQPAHHGGVGVIPLVQLPSSLLPLALLCFYYLQ